MIPHSLLTLVMGPFLGIQTSSATLASYPRIRSYSSTVEVVISYYRIVRCRFEMLMMTMTLELLLQGSHNFVTEQKTHLFHWNIGRLGQKKEYKDPHGSCETNEQDVKLIATVCKASRRRLKISNGRKPEALSKFSRVPR